MSAGQVALVHVGQGDGDPGAVGRGRTNAEIGRALLISETTVKTYLLRAYGKLGVSERTAAVTRAIELGMLPAPGARPVG